MTENEISYKIRGAIFEIYNTVGPGLLESAYEAALYYELKKDGLKVERQLQLLEIAQQFRPTRVLQPRR